MRTNNNYVDVIDFVNGIYDFNARWGYKINVDGLEILAPDRVIVAVAGHAFWVVFNKRHTMYIVARDDEQVKSLCDKHYNDIRFFALTIDHSLGGVLYAKDIHDQAVWDIINGDLNLGEPMSVEGFFDSLKKYYENEYKNHLRTDHV